MSKRAYFLIAGGVFLATLAFTAGVFPSLPAQVPVHWSIHNQIDRYGSKWTLVYLMPGTMAGFIGLMAALPWLSPRRFEVDDPHHLYLALMDILLVFFAYFQALMILAALGQPLNMTRAIFGGLCLIFVAIGAIMPRLPRNFYVGVRTPWTIADERVWKATHQFAGRAMITGGVIAFVLAMLQSSLWPPVALLLGAGLAPIVHSVVFYKELEKHGQV